MFQRIAFVVALTMVILGITCPETSEGFAIERHWKPYDLSPETKSCRLSAEEYKKSARVCDECSALFNVKEMHDLCQGNCFKSDYFRGCLNVLETSTEVLVADDFFDPQPDADEGEE